MTRFRKPVAALIVSDIEALVDEGIAESQYLEFKKEIPRSKEEQKRSRNRDANPTIDPQVADGHTLSSYGRDELLEELVAFANADGGLLIVGISETDDLPHRAKALCPIPDIVMLERQLRDAVVSCVEPRLPHVSVKAIVTRDDGAGLVLLEVEASRLGPHRVNTTRKATVRRGDSCVPMSMMEIHDMVLRNARRFDSIVEVISQCSAEYRENFVEIIMAQKPQNRYHLTGTADGFISGWFANEGLAAVGFHVAIIAHADLGLNRLERLDGLVPGDQFVQQAGEAGGIGVAVPGASKVWAGNYGGRRILGGVHQTEESEGFHKTYVVKREGFVEASVVLFGRHGDVRASSAWLACMLGCALGIYDRLRLKAGAPSMPAEVSVEVLTRGVNVRARIGSRSFREGPNPLPAKLLFPRHTISDIASFGDAINEIVGDLANAGNLAVDALPLFHVVQ